MQPINILTYVLFIIVLSTVLFKIVTAIKKSKEDDGKLSAVEMAGIALKLRKDWFEIIKTALELKAKESQGDEFVKEYVITHIKGLINDADWILPCEKELLIDSDLEEITQIIIDMFDKDKKVELIKPDENKQTDTIKPEIKEEMSIESLPADKDVKAEQIK